ncbi:ABC transporter substrate-binding protein [Nocardia salmonicida]|uniref:ABC transporter substrate-binding protein n=1 Tax=Nocardia salmonicida TaxID=53431 RepID=UPI0036735783
MRIHWRPALIGVIASTLLLSACSGGNSVDRGSRGSDPVRGGTLVFSDVAAVASWQTQALGSYTSGNALNSVLDRLTYFDKKTKKLVSWIATEFTQNADATQFTFTIRDGVTFSDGTPLDAAAVKANFDLWGLGNKDRQILPSRYVPDYDRAEVAGKSVTVSLKQPNASLLFATSSIFLGLVSPKTLALSNIDQGRPENVVGSGPFVFESQVPDQQIVLTRRAGYAWAPASDANQSESYLDKVIIKVIPEVGLRSGALLARQVDVARGIQPFDEKPVRGAGYDVYAEPGVDLTANFAAFRIGNDYVADERVRKALLIGFDRAKLVETVLSESFPRPYSLLNRADTGFVDLSDRLKPDLEVAKRLLDEAGWAKGAGGLRYKDGKPLELTIPGAVQQPAVQPTWEYIEQQWRTDLGVKLNVRSGDPAFASAASTDKNVPITPTRTWLYNGLASIFVGPRATTLLQDDPGLLALYDRERRATEEAERVRVVQDIQRYLIDKAYVLPTSEESQVFAAHPKVHIDFTSATYPDFQSAWIDPAVK